MKNHSANALLYYHHDTGNVVEYITLAKNPSGMDCTVYRIIYPTYGMCKVLDQAQFGSDFSKIEMPKDPRPKIGSAPQKLSEHIGLVPSGPNWGMEFQPHNRPTDGSKD